LVHARHVRPEQGLFGAQHFLSSEGDRAAGRKNLLQSATDQALVEAVYATLTSWGMHRIGPKGAKLVDFDAFKAGNERALRP
jgi:hypothetical protein